MSKFKRSFFSPQQIYKSLYTTSPSLSTDSSIPESYNKPAIQSSGLHLCRGTSVVCERLEVAKENKPPIFIRSNRAHTQRSILEYIVEEEEPCPNGSISVEYSQSTGDVMNSLETQSVRSREPLTALSGNIIASVKPMSNNIPRDLKSSAFSIPKQQLHSHVLRGKRDYNNKEEVNSLLIKSPTPLCPRHVWDDDSSCDAAPLSSWSSLGNRYYNWNIHKKSRYVYFRTVFLILLIAT